MQKAPVQATRRAAIARADILHESLTSWMCTWIRSIAVTVAVVNSIVVITVPLASIGGVARVPSLTIQRTLLPNVLSVLQEHVGVEELAVRPRVTRFSAWTDIERAGEEAHAQVRAVSGAVGRGADGAVAKVVRNVVTGRFWIFVDAVVCIAVGPGDHDLELVVRLAGIGGGIRCQRAGPEDAFDNSG